MARLPRYTPEEREESWDWLKDVLYEERMFYSGSKGTATAQYAAGGLQTSGSYKAAVTQREKDYVETEGYEHPLDTAHAELLSDERTKIEGTYAGIETELQGYLEAINPMADIERAYEVARRGPYNLKANMSLEDFIASNDKYLESISKYEAASATVEELSGRFKEVQEMGLEEFYTTLYDTDDGLNLFGVDKGMFDDPDFESFTNYIEGFKESGYSTYKSGVFGTNPSYDFKYKKELYDITV